MATRRVFTIKEKAEIISKLKNGVNNADLCKEYKVSHSTISAMWKNRDRILECFESKSVKLKKDRKPTHPDIESALLMWLKSQSGNITLSGRLLLEKANHFAALLGKTEFKCSESWIYRFRKRYDIAVGKCGVASSVLRCDCDKWRKTVPLNEDYIDSQIWNADAKDPEPDDDQNTSTSSTCADQTTSGALTVKCCRFCRETEDVLDFKDKPYVTLNKTMLTINDLRIEVDFNENSKTVCTKCDAKLMEIFEFVKVVKEAQDRLSNAETDVSNLNTWNEDHSISYMNDLEDDNYNKTNDEHGVEWLYESDSESVAQTVVARKRKGELKNLNSKKKHKDIVLDPLSLHNDNLNDNETNEMIKRKDEIDDKEYVKEVIAANGIVNVSDDDDTTNIKVEIFETTNDEDKQIQSQNRGIEIVVSKEPRNKNSEENEIKEEMIETRFQMDPTEDLTSIFTEKINELVKKRKVLHETVSSSEVTESSNSESVGAMNRSDLVLLVKTIVSDMLNK